MPEGGVSPGPAQWIMTLAGSELPKELTRTTGLESVAIIILRGAQKKHTVVCYKEPDVRVSQTQVQS
jgi:hypothetical protein